MSERRSKYEVELPPGLERQVLNILAHAQGKEKAVARDRLLELARVMPGLAEVEDRQVRKAIETLRGQGHRICNMADNDGYFIAATNEEYLAFRAKYGAYAFTILEKIKAMDSAGQVAGQPRLF